MASRAQRLLPPTHTTKPPEKGSRLSPAIQTLAFSQPEATLSSSRTNNTSYKKKTPHMNPNNPTAATSGGDQTSSGPNAPPTQQPGAGMQSASSNGNLATASATMTMTTTETTSANEEVLHLTLRPRPSVTWESNTVDNEGLGRKSSKRCCIFHKQRAFGESSTDSSEESDGSSSSGGPENANGSGGSKPIAHKKKRGGVKKNKVPDAQRFHA